MFYITDIYFCLSPLVINKLTNVVSLVVKVYLNAHKYNFYEFV